MKRSDVTQTFIRDLFEYCDGGLYERTNRGPRARIGARIGYLHPDGYRKVEICNMLFLEHRLIFMYHKGFLPFQIDHINQVRNDNRIENLRAASQSDNQCNSGISKNNTSGIKGVSFIRSTGKWRAELKFQKIHYYLGCFIAIEDATEAIKRKREELHGEFCSTLRSTENARPQTWAMGTPPAC